MSYKSLIAALMSVVLFTGCAQMNKKAFNKDANLQIKTVAISQPQIQDEYETIVLGHPGMSFGLVGALVAAADMQSKTNRLTAVIDPKELRLQDRFAAKLSDSLAKAGYQTQVVPLPKEIKNDEAIEYVKKNASVDAVLALQVKGSYYAAGPSTDYFPYIVVNAKSIDIKSGAILYEDNFSYGYSMQQMQTVHFASDSSYRFATIEKLIDDPAKTRQALISGIDSIADQIALDLKKN